MKKLSILASLLIGLTVFTACDSDRDDNPTLLSPTTFTMNTPAIGDNTVDLITSNSVELKASQQLSYMEHRFPSTATGLIPLQYTRLTRQQRLLLLMRAVLK